MQLKSFTAWVNLHLGKTGLEVKDLTKDFGDGIKLLRLVEIISEEDLGKYNKKPVIKFQKVENLNIPLKYINSFLKDIGILNSYSAENILEENATLICGMIWSLILRYNVSEISEGELTAKEGLLLWAKNKVAEGSNGTINITNFHNNWQDGMAFNALIQAFRPDLADIRKLDPKNKTHNLNLAFQVAQDVLEIPKLLDADDMVSMKPDEKSVMTYISLFWKLFAGSKRKRLAGERVTHVVQREQSYSEMQSAFTKASAELADWMNSKISFFKADPNCNSQAELEVVIRAHIEYGRAEKPSKQQDLLDLEALYSSITSRLSTLGRSFVPPEEASLPTMQRWWEQLTLAESAYAENLNNQLKTLKKMELYIKLFNSKAGKLEDWLDHKEAWLKVSTDSANGVKAHGEHTADDQPENSTSAIPQPDVPQPDVPQPDAPMQPEPTQSGEPPVPPAPQPASGRNSPASGRYSESTVSEKGRSRQPSFLDKMASKFSFSRSRQASASGTPPDAVPTAESRPASLTMDMGAMKPGLVDLRSITKNSAEDLQELLLTTRGAAMSEGKLDSLSAVQAKLHMYEAYQQEFDGQKATLPQLDQRIEQILAAGCPPFRQFALADRTKRIKERFEKIEQMGAHYLQLLREELEKQQKMDEMRVKFAKQAEVLNRWMEGSIDMLTEFIEINSISEAELQLSEAIAFDADVSNNESELAQLGTFEQEMSEMGVLKNPYSRFTMETLLKMMNHCKDVHAARKEQLQGVLDTQKRLDEHKRAFAEAAEAVMAYVRAEKQAIEVAAPAIAIHPDDAASIARGKQMMLALEDLRSAETRDKRESKLQPAQALADQLIEAVELDNPYTTLSMSALKSQVDQLTKVVSEKVNFIEAQLARAQADITPEQHEEMKSTFNYFDKSGDCHLNEQEFSATLRALGYELSKQDEEAVFSKYAEKKPDSGELAISLEGFTTYFLQQFKDKDTADELLAAFRTLADGKDLVTADELKTHMPEAEVEFLIGQLALREGENSLEYAPFAAQVYGK